MKLLIIDELRSKGNPAATEIILHSGFNQKNMNLTMSVLNLLPFSYTVNALFTKRFVRGVFSKLDLIVCYNKPTHTVTVSGCI